MWLCPSAPIPCSGRQAKDESPRRPGGCAASCYTWFPRALCASGTLAFWQPGGAPPWFRFLRLVLPRLHRIAVQAPPNPRPLPSGPAPNAAGPCKSSSVSPLRRSNSALPLVAVLSIPCRGHSHPAQSPCHGALSHAVSHRSKSTHSTLPHAPRHLRNRTHQTPPIPESDSNPIGPASAANAGGFLEVASDTALVLSVPHPEPALLTVGDYTARDGNAFRTKSRAPRSV